MYILSLALLALAVIMKFIGFGFEFWRLSQPYGLEQYTYGKAYYFHIGSQLLLAPSLMIAAYTGIQLRRFPLWAIVVAPYVVLLIGFTDRGGLIPVILLPVIAINYGYSRLKGITLVLIIAVLVALIVFLGAARGVGGLGPLNIIATGLSSIQRADWLSIVLIDVGAPATITTNIIRWFPDTIGFLYGQSYIAALGNLLPGFLFGGSINRPFLKMAFLYKDLMEGGQFNPDIGYGFALLAEAYANFGIAGSFFVMLVVGFLLQSLYLRTLKTTGARRALSLTWYSITLIAAILALRGEWLSFIKPALYGVVISYAIWWLTTKWHWKVRPNRLM